MDPVKNDRVSPPIFPEGPVRTIVRNKQGAFTPSTKPREKGLKRRDSGNCQCHPLFRWGDGLEFQEVHTGCMALDGFGMGAGDFKGERVLVDGEPMNAEVKRIFRADLGRVTVHGNPDLLAVEIDLDNCASPIIVRLGIIELTASAL
jgi:hypothetical protein